VRLASVELENFRSYREPKTFDCSADVVILVGPNGYGKTSFFDALGWCLFGQILRLRGSRDAVTGSYIRNHFAEEGAAPRVTVHLANDRRLISFERVDRTLQAVERGETLAANARRDLICELFPLGPGSLPSTIGAAQSHFYRSFLLGQDQMASFIRDTTPRDRFDALVSLLGVEIIRDFYQHEEGHLDRLQDRTDELRASELTLRQELQGIRDERRRLVSEAGPRGERGILALRSKLHGLSKRARNLSLFLDVEGVESREIRAVLRGAQQLEAEAQIAIEEEAARVGAIQNAITDWSAVSGARRRVRELRTTREKLAGSLEVVRERLQEERRSLRRLEKEGRELGEERGPLLADVDELRNFLRLALDHVTEDHCPLCEQTIDKTALRNRLEERITDVPQRLREIDSRLRDVTREQRTVRSRVKRHNAKEKEDIEELTGTESQIEELQHFIHEFESNLDLLSEQEPRPRLKDVKELLAEAESRLRRLRGLKKDSGQLVERAKMIAALDEVADLRKEEARLGRKRRTIEAQRRSSSATHRTVNQIIRSAKQAEREIVRGLLQERGPLLTALYRRLRPHPIFDELRVDYKKFAERGEAYFTAASREGETNIATTFSSAQLNAVAICVFLSLSLTQAEEGMLAALLDDPIQNMDDFNVLGLLDLVRQVAMSRQVVISTHDSQIGELMRRKLRPTEEGRRTITHRFVRYDADGPEFKTEVDEYEGEPYLLASALQSRSS
jgi:DNA repair exonuclease SbcCD ATPase subunit